mgnify:CR=1 FL=1
MHHKHFFSLTDTAASASAILLQPTRLTNAASIKPPVTKTGGKGANNLLSTRKPLLVARLLTPQNWVDRTKRMVRAKTLPTQKRKFREPQAPDPAPMLTTHKTATGVKIGAWRISAPALLQCFSGTPVPQVRSIRPSNKHRIWHTNPKNYQVHSQTPITQLLGAPSSTTAPMQPFSPLVRCQLLHLAVKCGSKAGPRELIHHMLPSRPPHLSCSLSIQQLLVCLSKSSSCRLTEESSAA